MSEPKLRGPWSIDQIRAHLARSVIPIRLAAHTEGAFPTLLSLWFVPDPQASTVVWCASHAQSRIIQHLRDDAACAFEVAGDAPPYHGVRGQARAELVAERGEQILRQAIERYLGDDDSQLAHWLLSRAADEVAIRLEPVALFSWDYRDRMADAVER